MISRIENQYAWLGPRLFMPHKTTNTDFKSDIAYFENTFQFSCRSMGKGQMHFADLFTLVSNGRCNLLFAVNLGKIKHLDEKDQLWNTYMTTTRGS